MPFTLLPFTPRLCGGGAGRPWMPYLDGAAARWQSRRPRHTTRPDGRAGRCPARISRVEITPRRPVGRAGAARTVQLTARPAHVCISCVSRCQPATSGHLRSLPATSTNAPQPRALQPPRSAPPPWPPRTWRWPHVGATRRPEGKSTARLESRLFLAKGHCLLSAQLSLSRFVTGGTTVRGPYSHKRN